jgi:chromosome segregation ATPase
VNRALQLFNLFGVVMLAGLCAVQWQTNRHLNLEINRLEKIRLEQSARNDDQRRQIEGCAADLDSFREQLARVNASAGESHGRLGAAEKELAQLSAERDQLKTSVTNWAEAVSIRDARLKENHEQLQKLADDRNEAVTRFNDLAAKYNAAVSDLNGRTKEFNALVEKYNAVVKAAKREATP